MFEWIICINQERIIRRNDVMATFIMDDGTTKSGDAISHELRDRQLMCSKKKKNIINTPIGKSNKERIMNTSIYDLLCNISDNIGYTCILESITGIHHGLCKHHSDCYSCIHDWLDNDKW